MTTTDSPVPYPTEDGYDCIDLGNARTCVMSLPPSSTLPPPPWVDQLGYAVTAGTSLVYAAGAAVAAQATIVADAATGYSERAGLPVSDMEAVGWERIVTLTIVSASVLWTLACVLAKLWKTGGKFTSSTKALIAGGALTAAEAGLSYLPRRLARAIRGDPLAEYLESSTTEVVVSPLMMYDHDGPFLRFTNGGKTYRVNLENPAMSVRSVPLLETGSNLGHSKELMIDGSVQVRASEWPAGLVSFYLQEDKTPMGMGCRVRFASRDYLLITAHQFSMFDAHGFSEVRMNGGKHSLPLLKCKMKLVGYSPEAASDWMLLDVRPDVWATLGVKALPWGPLKMNARGTAYGVQDGTLYRAGGSMEPKGPFLWRHRISTKNGWSGSPVIVHGHVVGMHIGGKRATATSDAHNWLIRPQLFAKWSRQFAKETTGDGTHSGLGRFVTEEEALARGDFSVDDLSDAYSDESDRSSDYGWYQQDEWLDAEGGHKVRKYKANTDFNIVDIPMDFSRDPFEFGDLEDMAGWADQMEPVEYVRSEQPVVREVAAPVKKRGVPTVNLIDTLADNLCSDTGSDSDCTISTVSDGAEACLEAAEDAVARAMASSETTSVVEDVPPVEAVDVPPFHSDVACQTTEEAPPVMVCEPPSPPPKSPAPGRVHSFAQTNDSKDKVAEVSLSPPLKSESDAQVFDAIDNVSLNDSGPAVQDNPEGKLQKSSVLTNGSKAAGKKKKKSVLQEAKAKTESSASSSTGKGTGKRLEDQESLSKGQRRRRRAALRKSQEEKSQNSKATSGPSAEPKPNVTASEDRRAISKNVRRLPHEQFMHLCDLLSKCTPDATSPPPSKERKSTTKDSGSSSTSTPVRA